MKIDLESHVRLDDGHELIVRDVVVDPYHLDVTHLAMTLGSPQPTRLIPIGDVDEDDNGLRLHRSSADLANYAPMDEMSYVRIAQPLEPGPRWSVGISGVLTLPYYDAELMVGTNPLQTVSWHRIPAGDVEVRRRSRVTTVDQHDVGHVEGFVTDDRRHVSHLVVDHGHLFGHRDLVVPLDAIDGVANDNVTLSITRDEVRDLPRAQVRSWWDRHRPGSGREPTEPTARGSTVHVPWGHDRRYGGTRKDGLRADHPIDDGIDVLAPDRSHEATCRSLARDAHDRLRDDGLSLQEIWEWSEAFVAAEGHGSVDDLVAWIQRSQHHDAPVSSGAP